MAHADEGLTSAEAARRLAAEGRNVLASTPHRGALGALWEVLREPMFLLLLAGVVIYLLLGDTREALILAVSMAVMIVITVAQERRSERALEALRDLSSPRAMVLRDGAPLRIAGVEVVRGDLMLIAEGDRVPADARLTDANDLRVDESLLTGESAPVDKLISGTRDGMVYAGTLVIKGQGRAQVTATGARSELGRIGVSLATLDAGKTTLQGETARMVRVIAAVGLALCVALALFYGVTRGDWLAGVLAGVTLAMAILPEEFPVVLMIFLALGAWRIAQRGVLTRRMPALEMLGAATILCVDKTGTLTQNRMALTRVFHGGAWHGGAALVDPSHAPLLEAAALACEADPFDPMEREVLVAAARAAPSVVSMRRGWRLERDYPFAANFQAVCHAWRAPSGEARVGVKGAPETVLALCGLSAEAHAAALAQASQAAAGGLRVLAVASAPWHDAVWPDDPRRYAFHWLGLVAFADPLRDGVPEAVALCRGAGIRVLMITGDYPATALAIAREAGIEIGAGVLTGAEMDGLDDAQLALAVRRVNVFARVQPQQKLRLVAACKRDGEVVAMTGDGVNDAPALKAAHIGVAMGLRGTDVAREAAALVLLEDDFGSIVDAVRMGRRIYTNIRNAMGYLIAVHVPIAGMTFLPVVMGMPPLLFPVHVVFLEFVIDPACSIVFEAEASDARAMQRPPRDPRARLFSRAMVMHSFLLGLAALAAVGGVYLWSAGSGHSEAEVRTVGFVAIVIGNLLTIFVHRAGAAPLHTILRQPNPAFHWIAGATLAALALCIYVPFIADVFRFAPLTAHDFLIAVSGGLAGVVVFEVITTLAQRATQQAT